MLRETENGTTGAVLLDFPKCFIQEAQFLRCTPPPQPSRTPQPCANPPPRARAGLREQNSKRETSCGLSSPRYSTWMLLDACPHLAWRWPASFLAFCREDTFILSGCCLSQTHQSVQRNFQASGQLNDRKTLARCQLVWAEFFRNGGVVCFLDPPRAQPPHGVW